MCADRIVSLFTSKLQQTHDGRHVSESRQDLRSAELKIMEGGEHVSTCIDGK